MSTSRPKNTNQITAIAQKAAAIELGCNTKDIQIIEVDGGYSRNRRSLVGYKDKWMFVKEVDLNLLPDDGTIELGWLKKDYDCTRILRSLTPEIVPDWGKLVANNHVYLMPSYRIEDGWTWTLPSSLSLQKQYIQAVISATKQLESVKFDRNTMVKMKFHPYFRDELALDGGLVLITQNKEIRNQLINKYSDMLQNKNLINLHSAFHKIILLFKDVGELKRLSARASDLVKQPNDCFGHCDVRSDNIAFNKSTGQIKIVDWNWASFATARFGATEFLIDMSKNGVDVTSWTEELNIEMLAAIVGFYATRCLKDPLAPGNMLRDMQAQSAAIAFDLYDKAIKY